MKIKKQNKKYFITLLFSACFWLPQTLLASSYIVSTIKNPDLYSNNQSWFRYLQTPGTTITDSIILRNIGPTTESIKLYATDATANQSGSFAPKMENDPKIGLGAWTQLDQQTVTLEPNESTEVHFKINIPPNTAPGQYFGSIINEQISGSDCADTAGCSANIQIKTRTGNRIYLTIPGEVKADIKLTDFSWKTNGSNSIHFQFNFVNNGNIAFEPKAIIHIYNLWNQEVATFESRLGKSLPGTVISPMADWDNNGHLGNFTAKAEIYYIEDDQGRNDPLHGSSLSEKSELSFYIFPWTYSIISLWTIILLMAIWGARKAYYRKMRCAVYVVKDGDNLMDIAAKYQTSWHTIACINKLKAPYILTTQQEIQVPCKKITKNEN